MSREEKLKYFAIILIAGFGFSVFYHYIINRYVGLGYPWNTFLFMPVDHFNDFYNIVIKGTAETIYFPIARLVIVPFQMFRSHVLAMIVYMLLVFIPIVYYNWINLKCVKWIDSITYTFVFTFLAYPVLFLIDRANFESFVYLSLCLFIILYKQGKILLSCIPLAFAISLKLFPAVFVILLIADKKYKETFFVLAFVVLLSFTALMLLPGTMTENLTALFGNQQKYNKDYAVGFGGFDFGNSLFGIFKAVFIFLQLSDYIHSILLVYILLAFLGFLFLAAYIIFIEKVFWKKVTLLVIAMCILPHVSGDYKLIHLLIPIFLFINLKEGGRNLYLNIHSMKFRLDLLYTLLFAILLIPKNYRLFFNVYDGVILDPLIMVMIVFLIIYSGLSRFYLNFVVNSVEFKNKGKLFISE